MKASRYIILSTILCLIASSIAASRSGDAPLDGLLRSVEGLLSHDSVTENSLREDSLRKRYLPPSQLPLDSGLYTVASLVEMLDSPIGKESELTGKPYRLYQGSTLYTVPSLVDLLQAPITFNGDNQNTRNLERLLAERDHKMDSTAMAQTQELDSLMNRSERIQELLSEATQLKEESEKAQSALEDAAEATTTGSEATSDTVSEGVLPADADASQLTQKHNYSNPKVDSLLSAHGLSRGDSIPMEIRAEYDSLLALYPDSSVKVPSITPVAKKPRPNFGPRNWRVDTVGPSRIVRSKVDLDHPVKGKSADSMIMIRRDSALMYGSANVQYGEMKLDAYQIEIDLNTSNVYAVGQTDSLGEVKDSPVFDEGGQTYEATTMKYNFQSRKGFITNVITEQGEGYVTGGRTKKNEDDSYFVENVRYTTCDDHECPHFYMNITKGRMRPGKNIVTGPAYMVLAGLPLPIAVPFGFFPFSEKYSSGVIVPSFGDDYKRGYYLEDGGYYFALSDNIDLALTGQIYTRGSWGVRAQSSYVKRYKYSGNFNISYLKTIYGDKGEPDYSAQTNFQVLWSHTQDSKANPNMSLSASVNFTTSGYTRNDLSSYYSQAFTENTKSSSVNMTYRFPNSKWSMSTSLNLSQRTQDSTLTVSFPNVTLTMSQIYPFKRKKAVGDERWYEKIRMSYTGTLQNSLTAKQNVFFKQSLIKDWRNAMKHSIPISATFTLFKYINVTPSLNFTDRMYTTKVKRSWDNNRNVVVMDTIYGFYNVYDFSGSVSMDTKVYGFFQPLPFLGDKIKMIRHVLTPTISFNGSPDFGSPFFGYYDTYYAPNPQGELIANTYSVYNNTLYGVPARGKNGSVSFSLANNVEMKMKTNDSIGEKKVSLIENLTLSESYNFAADSLNWSNLNTSLLLRLTKSFNLSLSATWDVYTYQLNSAGNPVRVNIPRWKAGKGIGRLMNTGTSFSYTFNNNTFKKKDSSSNKKKETARKEEEEDDWDDPSPVRRTKSRNAGDNQDNSLTEEGYYKWECPWSLSVNYSISYGYGNFNKKKMEYDSKITQNLSFSGNLRPTENWNFSFSCSYDFAQKKIAYMNCNVSRDLHCFTMSASFVPLGAYKSYSFHIAVKSSLLSDLKYDKRSSVANGVRWY